MTSGGVACVMMSPTIGGFPLIVGGVVWVIPMIIGGMVRETVSCCCP